MKKKIFLLLCFLLLAFPAWSQSTIDPSQPASGSALSSAPIRGNFQAAYNDINRLFGYVSGTTSATSPFTVDLGTGAQPAADAGAGFLLYGANATFARYESTAFGASGAFVSRRANNTRAAPTTLVSGDLISSHSVHGYDGTNWSTTADGAIRIYAEGTWTTLSHPTEVCLSVTPAASVTIADVLCLHQNSGLVLGSPTGGNQGANTLNAVSLFQNGVAVVDLSSTQSLSNKTLTAPIIGAATGTSLSVTGLLRTSSPTAGLGYSTGAGGTVTQGAGSGKATAVTLNTATGAITMNGAALGAGTVVSFVLTDSAITAADTLVLNHISGGTPGSYSLNARAAAGSATIDVRNNTAGSLSEAIVIQFSLVKGSNS